METTTAAAPKVRPADARLVWLLLSQRTDLPRPNGVIYTAPVITLVVEKASEVEAWAEAMRVDAAHQLLDDGTWLDRAEGQLPVFGRLGDGAKPVFERHIHLVVEIEPAAPCEACAGTGRRRYSESCTPCGGTGAGQ